MSFGNVITTKQDRVVPPSNPNFAIVEVSPFPEHHQIRLPAETYKTVYTSTAIYMAGLNTSPQPYQRETIDQTIGLVGVSTGNLSLQSLMQKLPL